MWSVTSIKSSRTGVSPIKLGEGLGVGFVDVDPADADIHQHDALAPGQRVATRGRHHLADRGPGCDRHEPGALAGRSPHPG